MQLIFQKSMQFAINSGYLL